MDIMSCPLVHTLAPTFVPSPRKVYVIVLIIVPTVSLAIMGKLSTLGEISKRSTTSGQFRIHGTITVMRKMESSSAFLHDAD